MSNAKIFIIIATIIIIFSGILVFSFSNNSKSSTKEDAIAASENGGGDVLGASTLEQTADEVKNIHKSISVVEAKALIDQQKSNPNFRILDIRTKEEFDFGNIEKSENIDFYGDFETEIAKLDKSYTYLIYCRSGNRSGQAMEIFKKLNFKEVYDLGGGYNAWQNS